MSKEILLRGGTLVTATDSTESDLLVRDGKIAEIDTDLSTSDRVIDVTNQLVMPGAIDTHVHLQHPIEKLGIKTAEKIKRSRRILPAMS